MNSTQKSSSTKTNFHFKEDFFEEIMNGIPSEDLVNDDKKNSKVILSTDNKTRFNRVVKEFLRSEESKQIFINLIKKAKKREQINFLKDLDLFFFQKENVEESDEDDDEIEEIGEKEKKRNVLSKILILKKKFNDLKKLSKKKNDFLKIINTIRGAYIALSGLGVANAIGIRSKVVREMHEYIDPFLNGQFKTFMLDVAYPAITSSVMTLTTDGTHKIKEMISSIYEGFNSAAKETIKFGLNFIPIVGPYISAATEMTDGADGDNLLRSGVKAARNIASKKVKIMIDIINGEFNVIHTLINNPNMMNNGISGFFLLFGELDDNTRRRIDESLKRSVDTIRVKGDNIIEKIRSPKDSVISAKDFVGELGDIGISLYDEGNDYLRSEINNFESRLENIFDEKTSLQDKFDFAYRVMADSHFKSIELSPWSRIIRLVGGIAKKSARLFKKIDTRLTESNNLHSEFYHSKGNIVDAETLKKYFETIINKSGENTKNNKSSNGNINFEIKTTQIAIHNDGTNKRYFNFSPHIKLSFDDNKKRNFVSSFYTKTSKSQELIGEEILKESSDYFFTNHRFDNSTSTSNVGNTFYGGLFNYKINKSYKRPIDEFFNIIFSKKYDEEKYGIIPYFNVNNINFDYKSNAGSISFDDEFLSRFDLSNDFDGESTLINVFLMTETFSRQMKIHFYNEMCNALEILDGEKTIEEKMTEINKKPVNYHFNIEN